jgi:aminoglycoside 3-N-acetyltransferase
VLEIGNETLYAAPQRHRAIPCERLLVGTAVRKKSATYAARNPDELVVDCCEMHSRAQLAEAFRFLGVARGDCIMLHASVRAVGDVAGGPDQIHLALKDALTSDGTLIMYAGCPRYYDEVGRGNLDAREEREVLDKLPAFDAGTARSARDHGVLVEFFRTWRGTRVNDHVTRFAVWGRQADYLISEQPWDYALGAGSALERFLELDGKILMLAADHDTVTFLHYIEHVADFPDKRIARYQIPVLDRAGQRVWRAQEEVDSANGAHVNWPDRFFAKITDTYLSKARLQARLVGDAMSHLFPARGLFDFALPLMQAVARDARAAEGLVEMA